jgi:hypothetical protein
MKTVDYKIFAALYYAAEELRWMIDTQPIGAVKFPNGNDIFIDARTTRSYLVACASLETAKLSLDSSDG